MIKTARKSVPGKPFTGKQDTRNGRGPAKGMGGRPPEEYLGWLADAVRSPKCRKQVELVLADRDHPAFVKLYLGCLARTYGQPVQPVEHGGTVSVEHLGQAKEAFQSRVDSLIARLGTAAMPEFPE